MELRLRRVAGLPPLAWCARVEAGSAEVHVDHGAGIEARGAAFAEGAWNGPFGAFDPLGATVLVGTAGAACGRAVRFRPASDRLGPLFSVRCGTALFVSNSAVFAITASGAAPLPGYPFHPYDFVRIWQAGLAQPFGEMPLAGGRRLRVHMGWTLVHDGERLRHELAPGPAPPGSWAPYRAWLQEQVRSVVANAGDPARSAPFTPLAALSRGYDSTATAVLARDAGCRESFSFFDTRHPDPRADDGSENGRRLGMTAHAVDRFAYRRRDDGVEAEFALFAIASNPPLAGLEERLAGRLLVTGHSGDVAWGRQRQLPGLAVPWARRAPGLGQIEFRLRVGYLAFAPATIGLRHPDVLNGITKSSEMAPFASGSAGYDRPIARRIAQEAGIPPAAFARRKLAGGHSHLLGPEAFSEKGALAYRAFFERTVGARPLPARLHGRLRLALRHGLWRLLGDPPRPGATGPLPRRGRLARRAKPPRLPFAFAFTFQWACDALAPRYRVPPDPGAGA